MAKTVRTIPASLNPLTSTPLAAIKKRKVAGYARVSTGTDEQQTSYEAQVDYYTKFIKSRADWEFVSVYTDDGISGTSTEKRKGFQQMVSDALDGKIDLIVTKSVSRFARNTVDSLSTIRKLKDNGTEVFFEKENIWTFDSRGELLISIMSSLSQEESRSISQNVTWGHRKRMSDGKVSVPFGRFLGYDRGEDGNLVINEQEAEIVRRIYSMFLQGMTPYGIAKRLTEDGIKSPGGRDTWNDTTVKSILTSEKYRGDALLQKTFTVDYLTKKKKVNEGEVPQYYVENNHQAIIDPVIHEMVQREMERRGKNHSGVRAFSGRLKCSQCGSWYGSKVWHSNDKYRRVVWQCNNKFEGEKCTTPHLTEEQIKNGFIGAVNILLDGREQAIEEFEIAKKTVFDTTSLEADAEIAEEEMQSISKNMQILIRQNASVALDQVEYRRQFQTLSDSFNTVKRRYDDITRTIRDKKNRAAEIDVFLNRLKTLGGEIDFFSVELWCSLVDYVTVGDNMVFTFRDGSEITI